jgi:activator of HSP90 ATPase
MTTNAFTRRDFSVRLAALLPGLGFAGTAFGFTGSSRPARPAGSEEISHTGEAIHQEVAFKADRKRVYEALTDAGQFQKVVQLSAAMKSGMVPAGSAPAEISRDVGGIFSLFGGYISGRHVELRPHERIVQAWRTASWHPGIYSIVKFELSDQGSGTKLVLDHAGFPDGLGQHLADGWKENYWEPLEKYLAA